ncbi:MULTISPECIES: hypothetical protein [Terrisporobacter]|nr:hypothetical protein [Terrisporobacter othiniensis]
MGNDNLYLFAHSMGGAIGGLFLEKYNDYFHAAILNMNIFKHQELHLDG